MKSAPTALNQRARLTQGMPADPVAASSSLVLNPPAIGTLFVSRRCSGNGRFLSGALACVLFALAFEIRAADNEPPEGFTALFNGRDLSGWIIPSGDNGHWKVLDGAIDYDAESEASGDKDLRTEREFGDFVLRLDWRIKATPYTNPNIPYILPDGTHARDVEGRPLRLALPDSDSGVYLRGSARHQVNIWCWPIGSGEMYGIRMDANTPAGVRAGVTPRTQADKPVGEWNRFDITVRGRTVTVVLNGRTVLPAVELADLPARGPIVLQHHGGKRGGQWVSPPSLVQFRNVFVRELDR